MFKGLIDAFAMYSILPSGAPRWEERSKWTLCFFPLVGGVIGLALWLWIELSIAWGLGKPLTAAGALLLPLILSGGIHMDGFCDTVDAIKSHAPKERKLEILKDPHVGAFAVISCGAYLILLFGLLCELTFTPEIAGVLAISFVLSRALSALCAVTLRNAKGDGMLYHFTQYADRKKASLLLLNMALLCAVGMILLSFWMGIACLAAAALCFLYYCGMAYRQFGGVTGDLAGYFLCLCEMMMVLFAVVMQIFLKGRGLL